MLCFTRRRGPERKPVQDGQSDSGFLQTPPMQGILKNLEKFRLKGKFQNIKFQMLSMPVKTY